MLSYTIEDKNKIINTKLKVLLTSSTSKINKLCKITNCYFFDLNVVNKQQIQKINKQYRHINKPTDVISFALHDAGYKTNLLGEIFINYQDVSLTQNNFYKHFTLLFIHGVLHLLRFDHADKKHEVKMFNMQNRILKALNLLE
jgi:probable rRNA maturation factor